MADFTLQATIEVDGRELDPALGMLLEQIVVDDFLHAPDMVVLSFRDVERTVLRDARISHGSKIRVLATNVGGTTPEPLATAEVTALEAEHGPDGSRTIVRAYDASRRLQTSRRTRSFVQMKDSDIARQVGQEHGLELGTIDDSGAVHPHVAQANQTDWEFLTGRAHEDGFKLGVADGRFHFQKAAAPEGAPPNGDFDSTDPLQLVVGTTLLEFHPRVTSGGQVKEAVVRGWDPKTKKALVGRAPAKAASALVAKSPGDLAATVGAPIHIQVDRPFSTQAAVDAQAQSNAARFGSVHAEATAIAQGHPKLKPGRSVRVSVAGESFDGTYFVTQARHVFDAIGYRTHLVMSGQLDRSLLALVGSAGRAEQAALVNGVVVALVTNNNDPEELGRVRLKFPWLADDYESDWARVVSLGAGPDSGAVFMPEVNDEVLAAFEFADVRRPYVLGGLHNGLDRPRLGDGLVDNGKVRRRGIVSRRGHRLVFHDAADKSGVILRSGDDHLNISINETEMTIGLRSDGTIVIEATGDISVKSAANVTVEAGAQLTLNGATVSVTSSGPVDIDGTPIQLN
jgi:phage protein D